MPLVDELAESGMTMTAFAGKKGVRRQTLSKWTKVIAEAREHRRYVVEQGVKVAIIDESAPSLNRFVVRIEGHHAMVYRQNGPTDGFGRMQGRHIQVLEGDPFVPNPEERGRSLQGSRFGLFVERALADMGEVLGYLNWNAESFRPVGSRGNLRQVAAVVAQPLEVGAVQIAGSE